MSELMDLVSLANVEDGADRLAIIITRTKRLEELIDYCNVNSMPKTAAYLSNAKNDLFTCVLNKMANRTTSNVERVMRTINMRVNVGKWSKEGALNVNKVRLAYYYNGFLNCYRVD